MGSRARRRDEGAQHRVLVEAAHPRESQVFALVTEAAALLAVPSPK
jgi:hypothetical protein